MIENKEKGFTIIEVALVLAVAALIFLVVFLAVPALQRNQRDDARKRDVAIATQAAVAATAGLDRIPIPLDNNTKSQTVYATDYTPPQITTTDLGPYLDNLSNNIDRVVVTKTTVVATGAGALIPGSNFDLTQLPTPLAVGPTINWNYVNPQINQIVIYIGAKCDGNVGLKSGTRHSFAVVVQVENGGRGKYHCEDVG